MKPAIIAYGYSENLGDWIQSLIFKYLWHESFIEIDREHLSEYRGPKVKLVCNGWFLENPKNWPPSNTITPLFISFHITPRAAKELTKPLSIDYFKKFEPIGCRDFYTRDLLQKFGVKSYFSGCITLAYEKSIFSSRKINPSGILVAGALDRLKPVLKLSNNPMDYILQIMKLPFKFWKYQLALYRLNNALTHSDKPITKISQIINHKRIDSKNLQKLAFEYLKKIANAELVITSRIHTALPAVGMNIPVLFLDDGLHHINHKSRLEGLTDFFQVCSSKHLHRLDLSEIKTQANPTKIKDSLKNKIHQFMFGTKK